jgi:hypothetical protein
VLPLRTGQGGFVVCCSESAWEESHNACRPRVGRLTFDDWIIADFSAKSTTIPATISKESPEKRGKIGCCHRIDTPLPYVNPAVSSLIRPRRTDGQPQHPKRPPPAQTFFPTPFRTRGSIVARAGRSVRDAESSRWQLVSRPETATTSARSPRETARNTRRPRPFAPLNDRLAR